MFDLHVDHMRGNLSFATNVDGIRHIVQDWSWNQDKHYAPKSYQDIPSDDFANVVLRCHNEADLDMLVKTAFVTEMNTEERGERESQTLDAPDDDDGTPIPHEIEEALIREEEMLEELPLPGQPRDEVERKRKWLKLPRRARAAIRKMHREWGHASKSVLKNILKIAKAPKEYIDAADHLRCEQCELTKRNPQTAKSAPPKPYVFNHEVGIDVLDLHDYEGNCHLFLNIVDQGTNFQTVVHLLQGTGVPPSKVCADAFMLHWVSWAGWPKHVVVDRGLHNRGDLPEC